VGGLAALKRFRGKLFAVRREVAGLIMRENGKLLTESLVTELLVTLVSVRYVDAACWTSVPNPGGSYTTLNSWPESMLKAPLQERLAASPPTLKFLRKTN